MFFSVKKTYFLFKNRKTRISHLGLHALTIEIGNRRSQCKINRFAADVMLADCPFRGSPHS